MSDQSASHDRPGSRGAGPREAAPLPPHWTTGGLLDASDEPSFVRPRRSRRRDDTEMDITPMIDVTFLLLIFFIVASRMDPQKLVDLPPAKHGGAVPQKTSVVVIVGRGDGSEPRVYAGNAKTQENLVTGTLAQQEEQVASYVEEELLDPDKIRDHVLIMAEQGVAFRHVHRVYMAASQPLDGQPIHWATIEKQ